MNCLCGKPIRMYFSGSGVASYGCPAGKCKIYTSGPGECKGYTRLIASPRDPPDTIYVRFEAMLDPRSRRRATNRPEMTSSDGQDDEAAPTNIIDNIDVDSDDDDGGDESAGGASVAPTTPSATVENVTKALCVLARVQGDLTRRPEVAAVLRDETLFEAAWYVPREAYIYPYAVYSSLVAALRRKDRVKVQEIPTFYFDSLRAFAQRRLPPGPLTRPDPNDVVYRQLRGFQKEGVRYILEHGGRGMIADDMGLGKTVQAIAVAHHFRDEWPVLVVCPMSLTENWAREFSLFCSLPFSRIGVLHGTSAVVSAEHSVVIVSYASLSSVENANFKVVILDESHFVKSPDAKRTKQALRLCARARRAVLLSGTPVSRPIDLYSQLQCIAPDLLFEGSRRVLSQNQFGARYCNQFVNYGGRGTNSSGHSHEEELHTLLRHFIIRRAKDAVLAELPSKSRQLLYVHITDKEKKALARHVQELRTSVSRNSSLGAAATAPPTLSAGLDLKEATSRAKLNAVREYLTEFLDQREGVNEKTIIFAHYNVMVEAIAETLLKRRPPLDYVVITGKTPSHTRDNNIQHFSTSPRCRVAVLTMMTCGTGLNLTCADTVIFTELDWTPSTHLQCEDRVHRLGQQKPCFIKYLIAEGTADTVIWPLLQSKLTVAAAVLENEQIDDLDANRVLNKTEGSHKVARRETSSASTSQQSTLDVFVRGRFGTSSKPASATPDSTAGNGSSGSNSVGQSPAAPVTRRASVISIAEMLSLPHQGTANAYVPKKPSPRSSAAGGASTSWTAALSAAGAATAKTSVIDLMKNKRDASTAASSPQNPVVIIDHDVAATTTTKPAETVSPGAGTCAPPPPPPAAPQQHQPRSQPLFSIAASLGYGANSNSTSQQTAQGAVDTGRPKRTTFTFGKVPATAVSTTPAKAAVPQTGVTPPTASSPAPPPSSLSSPPRGAATQASPSFTSAAQAPAHSALATPERAVERRSGSGAFSASNSPSVIARVQVPVRLGLKRPSTDASPTAAAAVTSERALPGRTAVEAQPHAQQGTPTTTVINRRPMFVPPKPAGKAEQQQQQTPTPLPAPLSSSAQPPTPTPSPAVAVVAAAQPSPTSAVTTPSPVTVRVEQLLQPPTAEGAKRTRFVWSSTVR